MTLRYHPEPSTLVSYVGGGLAQSISILVAAHVEMCPACRRELNAIGAMAGAALTCAPAEPLQDGAYDRLAARLDAAGESTQLVPAAPEGRRDMPDALARLVGGATVSIGWRQVLPGVEHVRLVLCSPRGESALRLIRAGAGAEIPDHRHSGQEATLVLAGALGDGDRVYQAGDFCDLDEAVAHNPKVHGAAPCICAIAEEGPPVFLSPEVASFLRQAGI